MGHMPPASTLHVCRRFPHRATLSPVNLQNLAYNTKQRPLRSEDRGDGWNLPRSGDREDMVVHAVGVRTSHMSWCPPLLNCRRCPHRATLNPVKLQNLAYNTKQSPLRSGDRGDGWSLPWSGDREDTFNDCKSNDINCGFRRYGGRKFGFLKSEWCLRRGHSQRLCSFPASA